MFWDLIILATVILGTIALLLVIVSVLSFLIEEYVL